MINAQQICEMENVIWKARFNDKTITPKQYSEIQTIIADIRAHWEKVIELEALLQKTASQATFAKNELFRLMKDYLTKACSLNLLKEE
jgi:hypothetical protein